MNDTDLLKNLQCLGDGNPEADLLEDDDGRKYFLREG